MDALRLSLLILGALVIGGVYLWSSHLQHKRREQSTGWEEPDRHTISNETVDNFDAILEADEEFHFTSHSNISDEEVEKIYIQDDEDNPQSPSVFAKPKVYKSKLDETKSHIKAVHEQERQQQVAQTKSPKFGAKPIGSGLVIVINLLARPGLEFKGEKILRSVENSGLKYGDMNIFHYTGSSTVSSFNSGKHQSEQHMFSLTNIVNPGTFDKNQMSTLTTPGLSLFMQLPGPADGVKTFEKMLNTAQTLKKELDGELCDESRSALTYQTISHLKERIKEYCFKYQQA